MSITDATGASTRITSKELGGLRGRWLDQIHDDPEMSAGFFKVCYEIARQTMAVKGGKACVSNADLITKARSSKTTVIDAIKTARERGHLKIENRVRGEREFVLVLKPVEVAQSTSKAKTVEVAQSTSRGTESDPARSDPIQETPAAQGLSESPSLLPSLKPSLGEPPSPSRKTASAARSNGGLPWYHGDVPVLADSDNGQAWDRHLWDIGARGAPWYVGGGPDGRRGARLISEWPPEPKAAPAEAAPRQAATVH